MIDYEYYNALILQLLSKYLNEDECAITKDKIDELKKLGLTTNEAYKNLLIAFLGVENKEFVDEYFTSLLTCLDEEEYHNNPYYKLIKFNNISLGKWDLKQSKYKAYELFVKDDFMYDGDKIIPQLGYFENEFDFPAVYENDVLWMSVTPNEINTMKEPINHAYGNVLTFGLGLGYFAYMTSLKDEVKSVTIIEKDKSVIELFNTHILPRFEFKDKIKIIRADAYSFLKNNLKDGDYDYCFVDIYHDAGDGRNVYFKFKEYESNFKNITFEYWIYNTIKYYL